MDGRNVSLSVTYMIFTHVFLHRGLYDSGKICTVALLALFSCPSGLDLETLALSYGISHRYGISVAIEK